MDNKNKFKDIKQIILDGDSEQQEKDKRRPENLLIKYIKEINDFKTRVEKKNIMIMVSKMLVFQ